LKAIPDVSFLEELAATTNNSAHSTSWSFEPDFSSPRYILILPALLAEKSPIPMGASDFVNREIKDLLRIIRPSRSPYNNPMRVIGKKGTDAARSPNKRLVVDFRKLNLKTIADRYLMPNINMILSNLGRAKFFTTLDLKSGYH